jgi:hypothetical protein
VIDIDGNAVVENIKVYFSEIFGNGVILLGVGLLLLSMVTYTSVGMVIVKKKSSIVRAVIDVSRTVLVWIIGVIVSATLGASDKSYDW